MEAFRHSAEREKLRLNKGKDSLLVLGLFALQIQKLVKIIVDGHRRSDVLMAGHDIPSGADGGGKQRRCFVLAFKNVNNTLLSGALSFPVAPSGSLEDRIQSGQFTEHGGEIHIYTGLNQRGGDHTAGKTLLQAPADLRQLLFPVAGAHECGQVEAAGSVQAGVYLLGGLPGVDDTQDLAAFIEPRCQLIPGEAACLEKGDTAEYLPLAGVGRAEFTDRDVGKKFAEN